VRGGAIPLLAWGTILLVLFAVHAVWDGRTVPTIETAVAVLIIYGTGVALWLARRESIRTGAPEPSGEPVASPTASLAAVVAGLSIACMLFGTVWATFLIYFGGGMLLLSLGRLTLELRAERASRRRAAQPEAGAR
jgi:uncharacterized iron-regulated membrane protein